MANEQAIVEYRCAHIEAGAPPAGTVGIRVELAEAFQHGPLPPGDEPNVTMLLCAGCVALQSVPSDDPRWVAVPGQDGVTLDAR